LESSLEKQLDIFKRQKQEILYLDSLKDEFVLYQSGKQSPSMSIKQWLSQSLYENLGIADCNVEDFVCSTIPASLKLLIADAIVEISPEIYSLNIFSNDACKYLRDVTVEFSDFVNQKLEREISQGLSDTVLLKFSRRPPSLWYMGFGFIERLLFVVLSAVYPLLFPEYSSCGELDWCQGYVVGYSPTPSSGVQRSALVNHSDDSEVTINIALTDAFTGGELHFGHMRGSAVDDCTYFAAKPSIGTALIHSGRRLHKVESVLAGERFNLILWCRSSKLRNGSCPCCWMNDRDLSQSDCVCGSYWNS